MLIGLVLVSSCARSQPPSKIVSRTGEIEFPARVDAAGFDGSGSMAGYHAIVWNRGSAHSDSLLRAEVSDRDVLAALSAIMKPGPTLSMEAWDRRNDPHSRAPDDRIEGPRIEVFLRLPAHEDPVPLASVLADPSGRGLDLRFAGNEENIPLWGSGCIVCLYSCPGAKIGNARSTERDFTREAAGKRWHTRPGALPPAGTRIGVILRIGSGDRTAASSPPVGRTP